MALDPFLGQVCDGVVGPWWLKVAATVGSSSVVVGRVLDQDGAQVPFTDDQHAVGDLGPDGADEPFCVGVRAGFGMGS